jgi:uncharacterized protein
MSNARKNGEPGWIELGVPRGSKARDFYGPLFGWTFHDMEKDNFRADTPSIGVGVHPGDEDCCFVVYFAVDDIEAAVKRVRELGGEAPDPGPRHEPYGRFCECKDSQGVRFGLHQR